MDVCRYTNNEDNVERYKHREKRNYLLHMFQLSSLFKQDHCKQKNVREETEDIYVFKCCSK